MPEDNMDVSVDRANIIICNIRQKIGFELLPVEDYDILSRNAKVYYIIYVKYREHLTPVCLKQAWKFFYKMEVLIDEDKVELSVF